MKAIARVVSLVLLGWFMFLVGALVYAAANRREAEPQDPGADEVDLVATFGPLEFRSEAGHFRGGTVTTWFAGGEVDLRDAVLDPDGATLHLNALFGGGNLVVPESWNVESTVVGIGGVGDGRGQVERGPDAPTLHLEGTAIFGGWGITSRRPSYDRDVGAGDSLTGRSARAAPSAPPAPRPPGIRGCLRPTR